jgi:hypothetical protein
VLLAYGRGAVAGVDFSGDPEDVDAFKASRLGI